MIHHVSALFNRVTIAVMMVGLTSGLALAQAQVQRGTIIRVYADTNVEQAKDILQGLDIVKHPSLLENDMLVSVVLSDAVKAKLTAAGFDVFAAPDEMMNGEQVYVCPMDKDKRISTVKGKHRGNELVDFYHPWGGGGVFGLYYGFGNNLYHPNGMSPNRAKNAIQTAIYKWSQVVQFYGMYDINATWNMSPTTSWIQFSDRFALTDNPTSTGVLFNPLELAVAFYPPNVSGYDVWFFSCSNQDPFCNTLPGDMTYNINQDWGIINLHAVALHEWGHVMGLGHNNGPEPTVMNPYYGNRTELTQWDIADAQLLYLPQYYSPAPNNPVPFPDDVVYGPDFDYEVIYPSQIEVPNVGDAAFVTIEVKIKDAPTYQDHSLGMSITGMTGLLAFKNLRYGATNATVKTAVTYGTQTLTVGSARGLLGTPFVVRTYQIKVCSGRDCRASMELAPDIQGRDSRKDSGSSGSIDTVEGTSRITLERKR